MMDVARSAAFSHLLQAAAMVRLDAELLARTPSYLNMLKEREIDLRGAYVALCAVRQRRA